jgi:hypothetical protein
MDRFPLYFLVVMGVVNLRCILIKFSKTIDSLLEGLKFNLLFNLKDGVDPMSGKNWYLV